jgi:DNA-binding beta-propeller fold protein YncE
LDFSGRWLGGAFVRQWGTTGEVGIWSGELNYPTDVALGPGEILLVGDGYNDRVQVFAPDGGYLRKWGGPFGMNVFGPFRGWFAVVTSLAVDGHGAVFVADFYNHRVQKLTTDGTFLTAFSGRGKGPGQFAFVTAVAVAEDGTVFAADYGNNRIQKWRPRQ